MTGLIADNFNTYGACAIDAVVSGTYGLYAEASRCSIEIPAWEENGEYWLKTLFGSGSGFRRVHGAGLTSIGAFMRPYFPVLPNESNRVKVCEFRTGANTQIMAMRLTTDGNLECYNSADTLVAQTSAPCISAATLHKIQVQCVFHASAGTIEVRVDGVAKITATGLVLAGTSTQFFMGHRGPISGDDTTTFWVKDYAVYSLTGTYNSSWPAIAGVTQIYMDEDTATAGWTPRPREIIEAGVLYNQGSGAVLDCGVDSDYDIGNGDFTLETFVRFSTLPTGANFATILGKWSASTSQRSYRLVKYGPSTNQGRLQFEITTDGTLGTLVTVFSGVWAPEIGTIYNVCVTRTSGVTRLFIDGVQVGNNITDANTYFAANAKFTLAGEMSGVSTTVLANSSLDGILDETRFTNGVGRYTAGYTVTVTPYPTSSPADPDFADVVLLISYDEAIEDLSNAAQTLVARGSCARLVPDDGDFAYQTLDPSAPILDRFLEASLTSATGILTITANPSNAQTVTLGAQVYTFNTVLGAAGSVLIGVTAAASLQNLVAAINAGAGAGVVYGTGTVQNAAASGAIGPTDDQVTATAITPGTAGNSIVSTETLTAGAWTAATLTGGADIPGPTVFGMQSLPPRVTGVRWLEARYLGFLSGGSGSVRQSFGVSGVYDNGADTALSTAPVNKFDVFERDPNAVTALTPTAVNNGTWKIDRTA